MAHCVYLVRSKHTYISNDVCTTSPYLLRLHKSSNVEEQGWQAKLVVYHGKACSHLMRINTNAWIEFKSYLIWGIL